MVGLVLLLLFLVSARVGLTIAKSHEKMTKLVRFKQHKMHSILINCLPFIINNKVVKILV